MKTRKTVLCAALLFGAASLVPAFAAYPGVKGNATLTLTTSTGIGGFLVKDTALEKQAENGVTYEEILNPPGYNAEKSGANHYLVKITEKIQTFKFGSGEEAYTEDYPKESTYEEVQKVHTQKYTNAQVIQALIDRGFIPGTTAKGWKLVAIFPADIPHVEAETLPTLLFAENGSAIHYVGRQMDYFEYPELEGSSLYTTSADAILLDFGADAESFSYKSKTTFKHKLAKDEDGESYVNVDEEGTTTESETFSGKVRVYLDVFPGYYDSAAEEYINPESNFYISGIASYSGKLDTKNDLYTTNSLSLPAGASAGSFHYDFNADDGYYTKTGLATGGFSVSGTKVNANITAYIEAIPEALAPLKQRILAYYEAAAEPSIE